MKQLKNSRYDKDSLLLKLILLADSKLDESKVPTRVDFVGKREMDRSTLYNFDKSFQLVHADVGNLELTIPRYVLLVVDLYSSKVYVYPMHSRKQILRKMEFFYEEKKINEKKNQIMKS